jgi:prevent-host-death family protein
MGVVHGHEFRVPAGEFKQRCLAILDDVAETGATVVVTKRGRPVARVVPVEAGVVSLRGSIRAVSHADDLFTTGADWEAEDGP